MCTLKKKITSACPPLWLLKRMEGAAKRRSHLDCNGGGGIQPHSNLCQSRLPRPISCHCGAGSSAAAVSVCRPSSPLCAGTSREADATPTAAGSLLPGKKTVKVMEQSSSVLWWV